MAAGFPQRKRGHPRQKPPSFCNLISEVTSHHFGQSLLMRRKLQGLAQTQRKRIIQGSEHQEAGMIGAIFIYILIYLVS